MELHIVTLFFILVDFVRAQMGGFRLPGPVWTPVGSTELSKWEIQETWHKARLICQNQDADLVMDTSPEIHEFLAKGASKIWLGLSRENKVWSWVDGSELGQVNHWRKEPPKDPSPSQQNYNCAQMNWFMPGKWGSTFCIAKRSFVCQRDRIALPQPPPKEQLKSPTTTAKKTTTAKTTKANTTNDTVVEEEPVAANMKKRECAAYATDKLCYISKVMGSLEKYLALSADVAHPILTMVKAFVGGKPDNKASKLP